MGKSMRLSERLVVRRGLFSTKVVLQVADDRTWVGTGNNYGRAGWDYMNWHDASAAELAQLEKQKDDKRKREFSDLKFFIGQRVKATQQAGFNKGAEGTVVFQEPPGGIIWIRREGHEGFTWYYADELEPIYKPAAKCPDCKKPYTIDPVFVGHERTNKVYVSCQNKDCKGYDSGHCMTEEQAVRDYLALDKAA